MSLDTRSYTSGHFELQLDGKKTTAYLKSIDGGYVRANVVDEPIGPHNGRIKHTSTVDVEPFTIDFGISDANDMLQWIQASWRKNFSRKNGSIVHADFDQYQTFQHDFYNALIAETTFPALDGASKEPAYIKLKIQPETVISKKVTEKQRIGSPIGAKQKLTLCSGFRLKIDGIDGFEYTNKIESFTIKQGIKKFYTGQDRFPQIEPTKIEYPHLTGTISTRYADKVHEWYQDVIMNGKLEKADRSGTLDFLAPDRTRSLFRITLNEVGLHSLSMVKSDANAGDIKRMKFELYVGYMDIDGSGILSMA